MPEDRTVSVLSDKDKAIIQETVDDVRRLIVNTPSRPTQDRMYIDSADHQAPEVYIAKPIENIDAIDNYGCVGAGHVECYKLLDDCLIKIGLVKKAKNICGRRIDSADWLVIHRDKFGEWLITLCPGTGLEESGIDKFCPVCCVDEYDDILGGQLLGGSLSSPLQALQGLPIISDTFNDANGSTLPSHTPLLNIPGNSWQVTKPFVIQDNTLETQMDPTVGIRYLAHIDGGVGSEHGSCLVTHWECCNGAADPIIGYDEAGLVFRMSDTSNYWSVELGKVDLGGSFDWEARLYKTVAGSKSLVSSGVIANTATNSPTGIVAGSAFMSAVYNLDDIEVAIQNAEGTVTLSTTDTFNNNARITGIIAEEGWPVYARWDGFAVYKSPATPLPPPPDPDGGYFCGSCPDGAAKEWNIDVGSIGCCAGAADGAHTLTHVSGCVWASPELASGAYELDCSGLQWIWDVDAGTLILQGGNGTVFAKYCLDGLFCCLCNNVVEVCEICPDLATACDCFPRRICVSVGAKPVPDSTPGTVIPCCPDVEIPTSLVLTFTDISGCPGIDGFSVTLVQNADPIGWPLIHLADVLIPALCDPGVPSLVRFIFQCCPIDPQHSDQSCVRFNLRIDSPNGCLDTGVHPDLPQCGAVNFDIPTCSCSPVFGEMQANMTGCTVFAGCCDLTPPGQAKITISE